MFDGVGTSSTKTNEAFSGYGSSGPAKIGNDSIKFTALDIIQRGTAADERERDIINMRGISIEGHVRCFHDEPVWYHLALVYPRDCKEIDQLPLERHWFRAYGESRTGSFSACRNTTDFNRPINTDEFLVLKHMRFKLIPGTQSNTAINDQQGHNTRDIKFYKKIKKQFRYSDELAKALAPRNGRVFMAEWATPVYWDEQKSTDPDVTGTYVDSSFVNRRHYRETPN